MLAVLDSGHNAPLMKTWSRPLFKKHAHANKLTVFPRKHEHISLHVAPNRHNFTVHEPRDSEFVFS